MASEILTRITEDIKDAMKNNQKERLLCLRTLHAEIKNVGINKKKEITDDDVFAVIEKGIKQRLDAIDQFTKGGRQDLVQREQDQIAIYRSYQPKQLEPAELETLITTVIAETSVTSKKDIGLVMKALMPLIKGKADTRLVNQMVNQRLA